MDFFKQSDFSFFSTFAEKEYDKNNSQHVEAGKHIKDTLWEKTKYWSNKVIGL